MKQPTLQNQFDTDCQCLESKFFFTELLDHTKLHEHTNLVVAKPVASYPMSPTVLVEQLCLI